MSSRVLLVCCGSTAATRRSAFPLDEPLIEDGASSLRERLSGSRRWARHAEPGQVVVTGPELRCRETAEALGLVAAPDPALADWNLGAWAGQTLDELLVTDPAVVQGWLTEPSFTPPGGEPLTAFLARVAAWLDDGVAGSSPSSIMVVICTPALVRGALTHTLQAPPATFWRLDPTPWSTTELTGPPGHRSLRL